MGRGSRSLWFLDFWPGSSSNWEDVVPTSAMETGGRAGLGEDAELIQGSVGAELPKNKEGEEVAIWKESGQRHRPKVECEEGLREKSGLETVSLVRRAKGIP